MRTQTIALKVKGKRLRISVRHREGRKELILFIHGLGCSKESFHDAFEVSCLEEYSLLAFDLPGYGHTPPLTDFSYSIEDQAEICRLLLGTFGKRKVHIVGHSMGGAIGILLAGMMGENLLTFANIEGNLIPEDCGLLSRKAISVDFSEFKRKTFDEIKVHFPSSSQQGALLWRKWVQRCDPLAFYLSAQSLVRWSDSGELLERFLSLKGPKTYIHGEKNARMKVLSLLGNIPVMSISKSGHFAMSDNPSEFYQKLARFLSLSYTPA